MKEFPPCKRCGRPIYPGTKSQIKRRWRGRICQKCLNVLWKAKGYASERDLVRRLRKLGYFAVRMAVSGAGLEPIPDAIAFHNNPPQALAFEVKAVSAKRWTIYAWKREKDGKREPGQLVKCFQWVWGLPDIIKDKRVLVAVKFLLGERVKAPWVLKEVKEPENRDLTQLQNVTVDISDPSDLPVSKPSKRAKYIMKVRKERRGS